MQVSRIDHIVLTVADIEATCAFYTKVLGMRVQRMNGRVALHFGEQKINLHQVGKEFEPKSHAPTAGSGDVCFVTVDSIEGWLTHVRACGVSLLEGPVTRHGALGVMTSIYFRDPDLNLIEVARYA